MTGRPHLRTSLATPHGKSRYVRRLFATIADRYDLITVLLSYGRDARWKRRLVELAAVGPGLRAADLACGTGDIAFALAARGARVVGLDITPRMIELARTRGGQRPGIRGQEKGGSLLSPGLRSPASGPLFLVGDMMALPFAEAAFDLVTTGYGIRNVPDLDGALAEIRRVLRPGGVFLSLDFNRPANSAVRAVYLGYLTVVGAALGWALHRDPDTYRYIPESIKRYPGADAVARRLEALGFGRVRYLPVLGGLMAIHEAR
jgi:demethylmenaquinone methyltransferase/2-methoxy-6-polyprenyl-1,4-benzoquinol methylase